VSVQLLAQLRIRAGYDHGDRGPVSNVPPCRGQDLGCARLDPLEQGRQVTDHSTGSLGQGQLDRPVQILIDFTKQARHVKDRYLAYGACPGL
jgi:hypothetical protein